MRRPLAALFLILAAALATPRAARFDDAPPPVAQQQLDATGKYTFPEGETFPATPLFVDSKSVVAGGGSRSPVNAYTCGTLVVTGWRRGLVDDSHFVSGQGFRTKADAYLFSRGTEWDTGPRNTDATKQGWRQVRKLTVRVEATAHDGWAANETNLCGMQGEGLAGPHPAPWQITCTTLNGNGDMRAVRFGLKLADGTELVWDRLAPLNAAPNRSVFEAVADLDAGTVATTLNGADLGNAGPALPPGSVLADNATAPFSIGRLDPYFNTQGFYGGTSRDVTYHSVKVKVGANDLCFLNAEGDGRVPTYAGGPSLPLQRCWTAAGGKYLWAVHTSQGVADANTSVTIRDLYLKGNQGEAVVLVGASFGPLAFQGVTIDGGTRGVQTAGFPVVYPLSVSDCVLNGQLDCGLFLVRPIGTIDRLLVRYPARCGLDLLGMSGRVSDVFMAPPGHDRVEGVVVQRGGDIAYSGVYADYEWAPPGGYALVRVHPTSYDSPTAPTRAEVSRSSSGGAPVTAVSPRPAWYPGGVRVVVDGVTTFATP